MARLVSDLFIKCEMGKNANGSRLTRVIIVIHLQLSSTKLENIGLFLGP